MVITQFMLKIAYEPSRLAGSHPLTCTQLLTLFLGKFISLTRRNELPRKFEHLQQDHVSFIEYEMSFTQLSYYVAFLIPTRAKKVTRFIEGLHFGIRSRMARETETRNTFT